MADSVYISKNLTEAQLLFMRLLDEKEILYFRMSEIEARLGHSFANLNEVLENLIDKNLLARIERGKYTRHDFQDTFVLSTFISKEGVVAYWSALNLHGLTERFPNKVFIKTTSRKRNTSMFGTPIQFVTVHARKMTGHINIGYGDRSYPLTDIETTILDSFDQPQNAGEWPDVIRAFHQVSIDVDKLMTYALMYNNLSIIKRMGYLAWIFQKSEYEPFVHFAKKYLGKEYSLIDPSGPDKGVFNRSWMLRMNLTEQQILDITQSPY